MDNPEKLAKQGTRTINDLKINVREYQKGNQKWTIQRNQQNRVHEQTMIYKYTLENTEGANNMDNPEKLAKQGTRTINDLQINVREY